MRQGRQKEIMKGISTRTQGAETAKSHVVSQKQTA